MLRESHFNKADSKDMNPFVLSWRCIHVGRKGQVGITPTASFHITMCCWFQRILVR